ncbi:glycosyltransferase [Nodosilinea sp. FACHB-141]|uniref:glycosyltransferase n=1 Tax=Nodosilinea sp. FACHB-141 TaxID=2692833 RepID=UPI001687C097|nr:glycosyltransferase [Nodosilinea sp. FACHB-141]
MLEAPKQDFKQDIRAYFDYTAPELDRWSRRNRYYYGDLARLHQFIIPPGCRVLEVGCGTGDLLHATAPAIGVGIDFAPAVTAIASQKYPEFAFYTLDAEAIEPAQLDPEHRQFDYILLSGVLGYLGDIQAVLQRLQPFCQSHTRLILTFHSHLWEPLLGLAERIGQRRPQPPQNWLSMDDVANLLTITGYRSLQRGNRFLWPKFVPGIAGLVNRYLAPLPVVKHLCLTTFIVARPQPVPSSEQPTCSVIIPARNEAGNIAAAVARLPQLGAHTEVIFVEGHSRDQTWQAIQDLVQTYRGPFTLKAFQQTGRGKADAVRLGFDQASGDILLILDADLTVPPEDLPHFVEVLASGRGEFANGSRLVYPRSTTAMPWLNMVANKIFALLFSFLLEQPLKDTLCGTKVLWRRDYERIAAGRSYFGDFDPFGDFDLLFGAAKLNLHIVEVPIRYQPRTYGSSNIAHVREGLILLKMCLYASRKLKFR